MEVKNRLLGLIFVVFGIRQIYKVIKNPTKGHDPTLSDANIIFGSLVFIGMGIAMMLGIIDFFKH